MYGRSVSVISTDVKDRLLLLRIKLLTFNIIHINIFSDWKTNQTNQQFHFRNFENFHNFIIIELFHFFYIYSAF